MEMSSKSLIRKCQTCTLRKGIPVIMAIILFHPTSWTSTRTNKQTNKRSDGEGRNQFTDLAIMLWFKWVIQHQTLQDQEMTKEEQSVHTMASSDDYAITLEVNNNQKWQNEDRNITKFRERMDIQYATSIEYHAYTSYQHIKNGCSVCHINQLSCRGINHCISVFIQCTLFV